MPTSVKACLAIALLIGTILGGVVYATSHAPSPLVGKLLGIVTVIAMFASIGLGASALSDYLYGPRTK